MWTDFDTLSFTTNHPSPQTPKENAPRLESKSTLRGPRHPWEKPGPKPKPKPRPKPQNPIRSQSNKEGSGALGLAADCLSWLTHNFENKTELDATLLSTNQTSTKARRKKWPPHLELKSTFGGQTQPWETPRTQSQAKAPTPDNPHNPMLIKMWTKIGLVGWSLTAPGSVTQYCHSPALGREKTSRDR